jgi:hypothetical protein
MKIFDEEKMAQFKKIRRSNYRTRFFLTVYCLPAISILSKKYYLFVFAILVTALVFFFDKQFFLYKKNVNFFSSIFWGGVFFLVISAVIDEYYNSNLIFLSALGLTFLINHFTIWKDVELINQS